MNPVRVVWVDTAKGYGIILVVFAHAMQGLVNGDLMTWTATTRFVHAWIYTFHMPLFFFLAGLFLFQSAKKHWGVFASGKLRTIAYPYFVWSTITVTIKATLGGITNHPYGLSDIPQILYEPIDQFWFLYVLFVLSLTISALLKLGLKPWLVLVLAILVYPGMLPVSSSWTVLVETRLFAIYLALGVVAASCRDLQSLSRIHVGWLALFVVAGLTASSLGGLPEFPYPYAFEPIFAVSGTVAVVALALLSGIAKLDTPIQFLGRYSLEIYVVHTIASAAVRIALLKIAHVSAPAPHLVLGTLAGLYIPIALVLIFNRVGFRFGFTLPKSGTPTSRRSDIPIQPDQAQM